MSADVADVADENRRVEFDCPHISRWGGMFTIGGVTALVRRYLNAAGITKKGSCHLFRHTMATLMLENGANIRYIQQMLGHTDLESTKVYTRISIRKLKEVHTLTHPASHHPDRDKKPDLSPY